MNPSQETALINACRTLFPTAEVNRAFLHHIQPEGLKQAYRARAWECHPDACGNNADQLRRTELFRRSVEAYKLLHEYLRERRPTLPLRQARVPKPSTPRIRMPERAPNELYYQGPMPTIELKLGLFLYYSGVISYQAVVRALMWQRDLRPVLGELACKWGWLTQEDVIMILGATHIVGAFGERAVKLGLLSQSQLNLLILHQRTLQQPIGRYLVSQSLITDLALQHHLRSQARHNHEVREARHR